MRKKYRQSLTHSFFNAWSGIVYCFRNERNFRIHVCCAIIVSTLAWYMELKGTEWAILMVVFAGVLVSELLNTALECVVDLVSPDKHPLAQAAKDVAAGAVLMISIIGAIVGIVLFYPYIIAML
ncbi:MAG: diacylglycerol kinase [Bacilli bacterium]